MRLDWFQGFAYPISFISLLSPSSPNRGMAISFRPGLLSSLWRLFLFIFQSVILLISSSLVLEVLKFQSRCNGLDFTLAIIAIWVNCLTIYPKGEPCPCGFPLLHRANLTLCAFLGGLPSFSIPLLYILARLCLRLCVCRFNWCCETEKDGSTWIPILIFFLVLHSSIE